MPPSHPRPEDLSTLAAAVSTTAGHTAEAADHLLDQMVTVGDHATQARVDDVVDAAADVLRELSAGARELTLALAASGSTSRRAEAPIDGVRSLHVEDVR